MEELIAALFERYGAWGFILALIGLYVYWEIKNRAATVGRENKFADTVNTMAIEERKERMAQTALISAMTKQIDELQEDNNRLRAVIEDVRRDYETKVQTLRTELIQCLEQAQPASNVKDKS